MSKLQVVLISDLKTYIKNRVFFKVHLLYLGMLSLIVLIGWPGGALLSFDRPQLFLALSYAQIIILTYLGGILAVRSSPGTELDLEDWLRYTPLTPIEIALGKLGGLLACVILMFSSSLPLIILSYFTGGVSSESALAVYSLLPLPLIAFINFGLLLRLVIPDFSLFTLNIMSFIYVLCLYLTRTDEPELFYINSRFLFFVLILSILAFFIFLRKLKKVKRVNV